ncbi:SURF1 family protein [Tropicimonas sediminicola]|uniref:SURF1-like protein n=1 Tax=Tropicimonas sediminicola TaxID=1031541 RepID=A0A239KJQ7_9RHOB|nr:SURF1 family protein [Tropicimonas sediminicola]SNT17839.1 surfeit locus 1 family protein [Tropicimonas sediminicola]
MRRYLAPLAIGLVGAAILIWLGVWQLQRLEWKEAILEEIDQRIAADPVPLPATPDPEQDRFLPVEVSGRTDPRELHVLVSTRQLGAGFRIITGFTTEEGRRILLDRGFVAADRKDAGRPAATLMITGNLHWPDERDRYTPENDPATNYWYAREVDVMADELGTEPILVIARMSSGSDASITPLPMDSSGIPNDHLGYAVTWFGLALVWLGMTALQLWRISRGDRRSAGGKG